MGFKPYHFCHCLKIFGKRFAPITYPTLGKRKIILESVLKWDISVRKRVASPFEIFFFSSFFYMRNSRFVLFFLISTYQLRSWPKNKHQHKSSIESKDQSWMPPTPQPPHHHHESHPIPSIQQPQGDQHVCCWAQLLPHTFRGMAGFHERAAEEPSLRTQWRGAFLPQLPQTGEKKQV